jgi:hypothetical protein
MLFTPRRGGGGMVEIIANGGEEGKIVVRVVCGV